MPTLSGAYFIGVGRTEPTDTSLGANERRAHIALIKSGYRVFFIMCEAQDSDAVTMSVKAFDDRDLRLGGRVVEQDGIVWIELLARVPVRAARLNQE